MLTSALKIALVLLCFALDNGAINRSWPWPRWNKHRQQQRCTNCFFCIGALKRSLAMPSHSVNKKQMNNLPKLNKI